MHARRLMLNRLQTNRLAGVHERRLLGLPPLGISGSCYQRDVSGTGALFRAFVGPTEKHEYCYEGSTIRSLLLRSDYISVKDVASLI